MNGKDKRNDEKLESGELNLAASSPVLKWLENFWYYHKWKVIIIAFFAIVAIVGIVQMVGKSETEATVVISVPQYVSPNDNLEISNSLNSLMPANADKKDKKEIVVISYSVYSEEELNAANEEETDENGRNVIKVERSYNVSEFENYTAYIQTGECTVMFISEYLYSKLRAEDRLRPMYDLFGEELPVGTVEDGYGVKLGDTYIYKHFESIGTLPPDTVVCLMRPYIFGASADEEKYEISVELFKKIVCFGE